MARLAVIALLLAATSADPALTLRAFPPVSLANVAAGCSPILFTAEIRGPEAEAWYCPEVRWQWPDGTVSTEESDCVPFEVRDRVGWHREGERIVDDPAPGFPRRWSRSVCIPARDDGEPWTIEVRLSRAGRVLARREVRVHIR
jgi:hypothetical protein